jgi:hypothetical protein
MSDLGGGVEGAVGEELAGLVDEDSVAVEKMRDAFNHPAAVRLP